ncbi:succinyl-diaminopimelate desuccinylase [Candidatus Vidania fulgoroideorum]
MIKFLYKIIKFKTNTPKDKGCQKYIGKKLKKIGFEIYIKKFKNTTNSLLLNIGNRKKKKKIDLLYSCHIDVVSEKKNNMWKFNPYKLSLYKKHLVARGTCDMKGSISCFIKSVTFFLKLKKKKNLMILITSDEEGQARFGTKILVKNIKKKKFLIKKALVGEPTSENKICDTVKIGRRGSCNLYIIIIGKQGHSAYPQKAINPIHNLINVFYYLCKIVIKKNSFQITSIMSNNTTTNIIPNASHLSVNIRYTSKFFLNLLIINLKFLLRKTKCKSKIKLLSNSSSFTSKSKSIKNWIYKIFRKLKMYFKFSRSKGGTSDGRFIKKICKNYFEIGLRNKYAHKYNEKIKIKEIYSLLYIYYNILIKI